MKQLYGKFRIKQQQKISEFINIYIRLFIFFQLIFWLMIIIRNKQTPIETSKRAKKLKFFKKAIPVQTFNDQYYVLLIARN